MKYKKLMLVTFMLLAILTMGAVSAVDNTNDTLTADNTEELSQDLDDEIISVEETDTQNILESGSATYSNLSDEISESGSIKLKYENYIYDEGATAITVSEDNKVIDGNGAVIDMKGSTIRAITVSASNVTIKNLTIKNGNYSGEGGAIYFSGSGTITIINCNFTNNAAQYGGAIYLSFDYFAGGSNNTIVNCNFINNTATADDGEGGAIRISGKGTVTNCNFINNTAGGRGGAIYIVSGAVENCNFINNTAITFYGGAIYFDYSGGTVSNCNFTNNNAPNYWGGAVYFYNKGYVKNSNFIDNTAENGGSIYMNSGTVETSNFIDNNAKEYGGSIYMNSGNVTNCNFTNNTALSGFGSTRGGAIYFDGVGNITNCNFINNAAKDSGFAEGGAIYFNRAASVENCNFTHNIASRNGGAVFFCGSGSAINCNFINNRNSGSGGAILFDYEGILSNCNFVNNTANGGGAVLFRNNAEVLNCNFTYNKATGSDGDGGAVYFWDKGNVTNCNFTDNTASQNGGAIYFGEDATGEIINCDFINNSAKDDGGAVWFYSSGIVKKSYFKGNLANNYPDIYSGSEIVSENNTFINNTEQKANSTDLVDIANVKITLSKTTFTYNAKVQKPTITLTNGVVLKEGVDYTLQWPVTSPKNVGTYTVTVIGIGAYTGTAKATFKINKATNPLVVKAKTVNVKFSAVKKKAQTLSVSKVVTFSKKGQGTLTYAKVNGNKKITINKKTGKVTVAKGLKKGTYSVKVKVKAAGNANYKASAYKTVTFKVIIK